MNGENLKIDTRRQSLLQEFVAAFPMKIPKAVQAALAEPSPFSETMEIRALLSGKEWHRISDDVYISGYPSILAVGSPALEYYLPGMMSAALRNTYTVLENYLMDSFRPPIDVKDLPKFAAQFAGFTTEQKTAVAHFMELHRDEIAEESPKIADRIDRAIHRYWLPPR